MHRAVSHLRAICLFACGLSLVALAAPASAEHPADVVAELQDDGVYRAPDAVQVGESGVAALTQSVAAARASGLRLAVVVPIDPEPDAEAFALRIRQAAELEAVLVIGPDGEIQASVVDDYKERVVLALEQARAAPSPSAATDAFSAHLMATSERSLPGTVRLIIIAVFILLLVLGGAVIGEQMMRRRPAAP